MRQDEIEVIKAQYGSEKAVIAELEKQYKAAIEAIDEKIAALLGRNDAYLQNVIFQVEHQRALRAQVNAILDQLHNSEFDTISEYLEQAYQDGYIGTMYSLHNQGIPLILPFDQDAAVKAVITDSKLSEPLYQSLGVDISKLKKTIRSEISRGIAAGMSYSEITRNVSRVSKAPISRAKTIVRTEAHRIQEAAGYDGLQGAVKHGAKAYKQWVAILDGKTRSDHRRLDGQIKKVDEPFELGTKKAMYPVDFGDPAEDCNCRCRSLGIAEWELTEKELDRLRKRAEYFGLDKTKDFEDFKKKYLNSVEKIQSGGQIKDYAEWDKKREKRASIIYDKIRDSEDIEAISKCSGFSELEIKEIKDHVFFDEHILYEGTGRFTPSLDMAIAWERLSDGKPEDRDILLLRHELLESKVEKEYNISASEAHAIAKEKFDWETVLFDLFGEEGEPYDLL